MMNRLFAPIAISRAPRGPVCLVIALLFALPFNPALGIELTGTVVRPDGVPIAGLVVEAEARRALTNEAGAFRLSGLDAGELLLRLRGDAGEGRVCLTAAAEKETVALTYPVLTTAILLHDNDQHFNFNFREEFEAAVAAEREQHKNVFLLNAGDLFVRHPDRWADPRAMSYYSVRCNYMIRIMNEIGYNACTLGNHELSYIEGRTYEALITARFPLLGANIILSGNALPPLASHVVFNTDNDLSIAVLGLTRANDGRDDVIALDPIAVARSHAALGRKHDLFVALTHLGLGQDRALAAAMPELDVIIGGHSHHLLEAGEWVNGVLIAMAGGPPEQHRQDPGWPKRLGIVTILFENDRIVEKSARIVTFEGHSGGHDGSHAQ